jgi:uncharacterized membrane protein YfcA
MMENLINIKNVMYLIIGSLAGISMGTIGIGAGLITMPLLIYSGLSIPPVSCYCYGDAIITTISTWCISL